MNCNLAVIKGDGIGPEIVTEAMRVLDAVLSKVPFVTTAKGVEGIDFKDGEDCLIFILC